MAKYHIGKSGPALRSAKYKYRFNGESGKENHYATLQEAMAAWAEREGLDGIPKNTLRKRNKNPSKRAVAKRFPKNDNTATPKSAALKELTFQLKDAVQNREYDADFYETYERIFNKVKAASEVNEELLLELEEEQRSESLSQGQIDAYGKMVPRIYDAIHGRL